MVNKTKLQPRKTPPPAALPSSDVLARVLGEVDANAAPLELILRPTTALALAGIVQAGLKTPIFADSIVVPFGDQFVRAVRVFFKDAPAVLALLDAGD